MQPCCSVGLLDPQGLKRKKLVFLDILQETNISHLGKRKIIFKYALSGGYVNSLEGKAVASMQLSPPCWDQSLVLQLVDLHVRLRSKPPVHHVVALPAVYLADFRWVSCG